MNYYIQIDSNNYIVQTISTTQTLSSPWISIPDTSLSTAQTAGATYTNGTVNAPAANYNLNVIQTKQVALVYGQLQQALVSSYAYTTSGGVSSTFPMDSDSQKNYGGAYAMYVLGGEALPSGFFFYDVNQNAITFAASDIKAFYLGAASREQGYYAAFEKAKTDIASATTVSGVQAITLSNP